MSGNTHWQVIKWLRVSDCIVAQQSVIGLWSFIDFQGFNCYGVRGCILVLHQQYGFLWVFMKENLGNENNRMIKLPGYNSLSGKALDCFWLVRCFLKLVVDLRQQRAVRQEVLVNKLDPRELNIYLISNDKNYKRAIQYRSYSIYR